MMGPRGYPANDKDTYRKRQSTVGGRYGVEPSRDSFGG